MYVKLLQDCPLQSPRDIKILICIYFIVLVFLEFHIFLQTLVYARRQGINSVEFFFLLALIILNKFVYISLTANLHIFIG